MGRHYGLSEVKTIRILFRLIPSLRNFPQNQLHACCQASSGMSNLTARLKLKPGQKGTKKLFTQYGDALVCVRYINILFVILI